ncbi:hypothetical protein SZ30_31125 [Burkholderia pseudomallei]|nr:hypothetical protein SZ30_31125 [Burkholderia pseudomallei]
MLPSPRDAGSARRHSGASTDRPIRTSTIGTSASRTEPSSRRAIEPSSHRAIEPPDRQSARRANAAGRRASIAFAHL